MAKSSDVWTRLRSRKEWRFFAVLPRADPRLALVWWVLLVLAGALPAAFAVAMGATIGAVQAAGSLATPLAVVGVLFVAMQVIGPIQNVVSQNLGDKVTS